MRPGGAVRNYSLLQQISNKPIIQSRLQVGCWAPGVQAHSPSHVEPRLVPLTSQFLTFQIGLSVAPAGKSPLPLSGPKDMEPCLAGAISRIL